MEMVLASKVTIGRVEPLLSPNMKVDWYNKSADTTIVRNAEACDMAFFISLHFIDFLCPCYWFCQYYSAVIIR